MHLVLLMILPILLDEMGLDLVAPDFAPVLLQEVHSNAFYLNQVVSVAYFGYEKRLMAVQKICFTSPMYHSQEASLCEIRTAELLG